MGREVGGFWWTWMIGEEWPSWYYGERVAKEAATQLARQHPGRRVFCGILAIQRSTILPDTVEEIDTE